MGGATFEKPTGLPGYVTFLSDEAIRTCVASPARYRLLVAVGRDPSNGLIVGVTTEGKVRALTSREFGLRVGGETSLSCDGEAIIINALPAANDETVDIEIPSEEFIRLSIPLKKRPEAA